MFVSKFASNQWRIRADAVLQAGIDDAAKAAGLAVGHLESSAEAVAHKVGGGSGNCLVVANVIVMGTLCGKGHGQLTGGGLQFRVEFTNAFRYGIEQGCGRSIAHSKTDAQ
jgi:hypothetical protein